MHLLKNLKVDEEVNGEYVSSNIQYMGIGEIQILISELAEQIMLSMTTAVVNNENKNNKDNKNNKENKENKDNKKNKENIFQLGDLVKLLRLLIKDYPVMTEFFLKVDMS